MLPTERIARPRCMRQEAVALRDFDLACDRSGSNSTVSRFLRHGRFTPETGHPSARLARQKSANRRHHLFRVVKHCVPFLQEPPLTPFSRFRNFSTTAAVPDEHQAEVVASLQCG
jgi:hypothetical protein